MSNSSQQSVNSDDSVPENLCIICLSDVDNPSTTDVCGHQFCFQCIERWSKEKNSCPVCKRKFAEIFYNFKEDESHDTLKVQEPAPNFYVIFQSFLDAFSNRSNRTGQRAGQTSSGATEELRRSGEFIIIQEIIQLLSQEVGLDLFSDSVDVQHSGQTLWQSEGGSGSESTDSSGDGEPTTRRLAWHVFIARRRSQSTATTVAAEREEATQTTPSTNDDVLDDDDDDDDDNDEDIHHDNGNDNNNNNKRPRSDEEGPSEPDSKRHRN